MFGCSLEDYWGRQVQGLWQTVTVYCRPKMNLFGMPQLTTAPIQHGCHLVLMVRANYCSENTCETKWDYFGIFFKFGTAVLIFPSFIRKYSVEEIPDRYQQLLYLLVTLSIIRQGLHLSCVLSDSIEAVILLLKPTLDDTFTEKAESGTSLLFLK